MNKAFGAIIVTVVGVAVAACGSTHSTSHTPRLAATRSAAPSAAELAIHRAVVAECAQAQAIDTSVSSAATIGQFQSGVGGWEAQLTAMNHIPMTGVPQGLNLARQIQLDYDEANLALAVAAIYDNPFGPHFSTAHVRRGDSMATSKLQDVLNRCTAAGQ
jgi:hypothetical protein